MAIQFALVDLTAPRPSVVLASTIDKRVDIAQASPEALVRGYNSALEQVLVQFVAELGKETLK